MEGGSGSGRKAAFRGGAPACTRRLSLETPRKRTRRAVLSVPLAALVALLDRLLVAESGFQIGGAHARVEVACADFKSEVHTRESRWRMRISNPRCTRENCRSVAGGGVQIRGAHARTLTYWKWRMAEFKSEVHLREAFCLGFEIFDASRSFSGGI